MADEDDNHSKFLTHLDKSQEAVWRIARWLNQFGYNVKVNASPKAETRKEWKNYADHGDLEISQRVEVKKLGVNFSGPKDWPFGDKFIVCAKHSFDRSIPKPYAYVILSSDELYAAIVRSESKACWYVEERKDSRYDGVKQAFYLCPLDRITFLKLVA